MTITLVIMLLGILLPVHSVSAYIDPGSGSFIIQVLVGILFGVTFTLKVTMRRLRAVVTRLLGKQLPHNHEDRTDTKQ
ncbi:MAG: hypothetical protein ABIJ81_02565 [Patescibacteria group bacterium]